MVEPIGAGTRNADKQRKSITEIVWIKCALVYACEVDARIAAGISIDPTAPLAAPATSAATQH